jgi:hypothetical protein
MIQIARRGQLRNQLLNAVGRLGALGGQFVNWAATAIVCHYAVPVAQPALSHSRAHPPESGDPDIHQCAPVLSSTIYHSSCKENVRGVKAHLSKRRFSLLF